MGLSKSKYRDQEDLQPYPPEGNIPNGMDMGPPMNEQFPTGNNQMFTGGMNAPYPNMPNPPAGFSSMNTPLPPRPNLMPNAPLTHEMSNPAFPATNMPGPAGMMYNGLPTYGPYPYQQYYGNPIRPPTNTYPMPATNAYTYTPNVPQSYYPPYKTHPATNDFLPVSLMTGINQGQVANLYHEFLCVTGGRQMLDYSTFRTLFLSALCGIDCNYLNSMAMDAFKTFDSNRDGAIDFVEFVNAFKMLQHSNYAQNFNTKFYPQLSQGMIPQSTITY